MAFSKYLRTNQNEPRLIDIIKVFFFIYVFLYTVDDFKQFTPAYLRLLGIVVHCLTLLILIDETRKFQQLNNLRQLIVKVLPFGLLLTYLLSYFDGLQQSIDQRGLPLFFLTFTPMIMYFILLGYDLKLFSFLKDKRKIYNYGYIVVFMTVYILIKVIQPIWL
jgi:hypothetical protein